MSSEQSVSNEVNEATFRKRAIGESVLHCIARKMDHHQHCRRGFGLCRGLRNSPPIESGPEGFGICISQFVRCAKHLTEGSCDKKDPCR